MLEIKVTNKFKKDLKLLKKRGYNIKKLEKVVKKLQKKEKLEQHYCNHVLKGEYNGMSECHIEPDWLLIYFIEDNILTLTLLRSGTHSDLF